MGNFKDTVYSIFLGEDIAPTPQDAKTEAYGKYEEAKAMVASGEATSMKDAINRIGVRDQVAVARAKMKKNPVEEVGGEGKDSSPTSKSSNVTDSTPGNLPAKVNSTLITVASGGGTRYPTPEIDLSEPVTLDSLGLKRPIKDSYSYNKALKFFAEQLKGKYIEEEVVNPEHQPMSKSEIIHRDKIRHKSPAKDARPIKGSDTKENAEYRLATYITMRGRKGKKKENK